MAEHSETQRTAAGGETAPHGTWEDLIWSIAGLVGALLATLLAVWLIAASITTRLGGREGGDPPQRSPAAGEEQDSADAGGGQSPDADSSGGDATVEVAPPPGAAIAVVVGELPFSFSADRFARANVRVDTEEFGSEQEPVTVSGEESPAFVEYDMQLDAARRLELRLKYASFASRPLRLSLNGRTQEAPVAGIPTGGDLADKQQWVGVGTFEFSEGRNVLRLETSYHFPHLSAIELAEAPAEIAADTPEDAPSTDDPAAPPDDPPPADSNEDDPWFAAVTAENPPPPFAEVCFDDFDTAKSLPSREELAKWLTEVPRQSGRIFETRTKVGQCAAFEGLLRLQSPWLDDGALRLSLENYNRLRIHFFSGERGLSLIYYEGDNYRWAAYATQRQPGEPRPSHWALAADDQGRCRRTEIRFGGPIEIRYRAGKIILSRGDIVLLSAPLPKRPEEVYLEGNAAFHGIALVRAAGDPPPVEPPTADAAAGLPGGLKWSEPEEAELTLERPESGAARLAAGAIGKPAWVTAALPRRGPYEVVLQLEDASPGAGVFLLRGDGGPQSTVRVIQNSRGDGLCVVTRGTDNAVRDDRGDVTQQVVAGTGNVFWIKMLSACGWMKWQLSADGVHWADAGEPQRDNATGPLRLGLICVVPECGLTLNRVTLRDFDSLAALAPEELRTQAVAPEGAGDIGAWTAKVDEQRPEGAGEQDWRQACAILALGDGAGEPLGIQLLDMLLDADAFHRLPTEQQFAVLRDAVALCPTHTSQERTVSLVNRHYGAAMEALDEQGERPFTLVRRPLMTAPFHRQHNFHIGNEEIIRAELLLLLDSSRWAATLEFCRRLKFFQQQQYCPLVEWAEATAARHRGAAPGSGDFTRLKEEWRQPLVEEYSKDAYNLMAELSAILESEDYAAAAGMITSIDPEALSGVAPYGDDEGLLLSPAAAVRVAVREHAELARIMNEEHGPLARLRVRRSIAEGNETAVRLVAVQFDGSEAAAEARQWLGDRALSAGWFTRALAEYRLAEKSAGVVMMGDLNARIRLAGSMLGRDLGEPPNAAVRLGEEEMSPTEFEAIVAEMLQRNAGAAADAAGGPASPCPVPPAGTFDLHRRGRQFELVGENPSAEVTRHTNRYSAPWAGRQIAAVTVENVLFASNRFQVFAYDLQERKLLWRSRRPDGNMLRSQDWTFTPMAPLVLRDRLYARLLFGEGPAMFCFDRKTGERLWTASPRKDEQIISDPLLIQGTLLALTALRADDRRYVVQLSAFDESSGEVVSQRELVRLHESWQSRRFCAAVPLGDSLVASLGGIVVCCDGGGDVRWIRRQIVLPTEEESTWVRQYFQPPLEDGGRLYVAQPGVRRVECLDADTGRLKWHRLLPDMERIVGVTGGRLIVQTAAEIVALDGGSGDVQWRYELKEPSLVAALAGEERIVVSRRAPAEGGQFVPELIWLGPADGRPAGRMELADLRHNDPRLGPLIAHDGDLWGFSGQTQFDAQRELIHLEAK